MITRLSLKKLIMALRFWSGRERTIELRQEPSLLIKIYTRSWKETLKVLPYGVLRKLKNRRDISDETFGYFLINKPKLGRFYLLPKIHRKLYYLPGRAAISNFRYWPENISAFLEYHLKVIAQKVKSYVGDTNVSLNKLDALPSLPEDIILGSIDALGLYPYIPDEYESVTMRKALDERQDKTFSTDFLTELEENLLKSNISEHVTFIYNQLRGTVIGTKMATLYSNFYAWLGRKNL